MSAKLNAELIQFIEYFNLIKMVNRDTFWSWLMNRLSEIKESGAAALWRYCLKIYAGLDMMSTVCTVTPHTGRAAGVYFIGTIQLRF